MAAASGAERALLLPCGSASLTAVLHHGHRDTGVLLIVGGPQYRAGSHRQFVLLARFLANAGFPVLRFDMRGMGDSSGQFPGFEHCTEDVSVAINALFEHEPALRRVVLWGLCDGASAALLYLHDHRHDPRVTGLCLLNPWVRSDSTLALARSTHYYRDRIRDPAFWRKLLAGGVSPRALLGWWQAKQMARVPAAQVDKGPPRFQDRMRDALSCFRGDTLLVLSGRDLTAQEFEQVAQLDATWRRALATPSVTQRRFQTADHTFSELSAQAELFEAILGWLARPAVRATAESAA